MTSTPGEPDAAEELIRRIEQSTPPGYRHVESTVVHQDENVFKTATIYYVPQEGDDGQLILMVNSWTPRPDFSGFDLRPGASRWTCEDAAIGELHRFLSDRFETPEPTEEPDAPLAAVIRKVQTGETDAGQLAQLAEALAGAPNAAGILAAHGAGQVLLDGIQAAKQRDVIAALSEVVRDPDAKENEFQQILQESWWMFGGRFVEKAKRRQLTVMTQLDVPLIRADGALHVVELKRACVPNLVIPHRDFFVVGPEVNKAVGQSLNYLREFDEERNTIQQKLGIECRRAFATVVIGHPQHVPDAQAREHVPETLRTYNAHLSRVEVITYADLIQGAEKALELAPSPAG
ncbi:Shedu anti-phage system protein SduA domain-containing protein [Amycolatopsis sp. lyj-109]|uniref:Shedu anti-phage system protein SduA domain-containing protein n=1 Tax=Amycolatopsis sp. lyj-109 TaxID=2789287 RepID=UPI0039783862